MNLNSSATANSPRPQQFTDFGNHPTQPLRVLLIGPTGFIGSRILAALEAHENILLSILTRRADRFVAGTRTKVLSGDLAWPESITRAVRHSDVVINAASYVGDDEVLARRVNVDGGLSVIRACEEANVERLIQISTTAVYGSGPHIRMRASKANYHPESAASSSRSVLDRAVLAAGGLVIRPSLIYGAGDRWFIPGVVRMVKTLGATINDGDARLSMIDVEELGHLVAALALRNHCPAGAYHAADPAPSTLADLLSAIHRNIAPLAISASSSLEDAVQHLIRVGMRAHQVNLLGMDHYYEASELWNMAERRPPGFCFTPQAITWYKTKISP